MSMVTTSACLNKMIKKLNEDKSFLISELCSHSTFVVGENDDIEKVKPDFDYRAVCEKIAAIDETIFKYKHALNLVNTTQTINVLGKDITIESLNFNKKKATVGKNKAYNKMLHMLDYSRYTEMLQNACHRKQVGLIQINPAYTSVIGEKKYGKTRKLNRHQAASYVIARLGQGYTDTYGKYKTIA